MGEENGQSSQDGNTPLCDRCICTCGTGEWCRGTKHWFEHAQRLAGVVNDLTVEIERAKGMARIAEAQRDQAFKERDGERANSQRWYSDLRKVERVNRELRAGNEAAAQEIADFVCDLTLCPPDVRQKGARFERHEQVRTAVLRELAPPAQPHQLCADCSHQDIRGDQDPCSSCIDDLRKPSFNPKPDCAARHVDLSIKGCGSEIDGKYRKIGKL